MLILATFFYILQLCLPCFLFKEGFGGHGAGFVGKCFLVKESDREASTGVLGTFSCVVGFESASDICRVARVEAAIRTLQDIHISFTFHSKSRESLGCSCRLPRG